jgi:hypothetical protein
MLCNHLEISHFGGEAWAKLSACSATKLIQTMIVVQGNRKAPRRNAACRVRRLNFTIVRGR